ncbi:MAG: TonB-dependent receptor [Alistipes sp.]|nr:TonB-dependent receptor [Alistipes sp.]
MNIARKTGGLLWAALLWTMQAAAQGYVSGTVTDMSGTPLPGATITIQGSATGTTADAEGRYALPLPAKGNPILNATFIGYRSEARMLGTGGQGPVDFRLEEDVIGMEQVVVTGTRTPRLLKDAPIVTRVLTADDIRKVDATHIGDLLQSELPGIEFSYAMNQQVSLNMQGFGGNSVLFLVDGERLAGETLDNIDYTRLNMDNVERVEIVKGAASSLYGSNAVGGVVNLISKRQTEAWTANLNARCGAHNEQRYGGSAGFKAGKFANTLNVQHTSVNSVTLKNAGDYSTVYGSRTWNFKERLTYDATEKLGFTARAGYFFRERNSSEASKERYRDFSGGISGRYDIDDRNRLEICYSFDQYDKSDYGVRNKTDVRDYSNVQHIVRGLYNRTFAQRHTLTVGGDFMRDYLMSYQFADNGAKHQYTADAFAQFDWNPSLKFNLVAGLRFDRFSETGANRLSPKLGVMYKAGNCSLRGSYAGGFRAPTLKEMYMNFDMASIFMIYGNPELKSETSHNFSLSAEYIRGRWSLTATGFYNLVDNRIATAWNRQLNGMQYVNMAALQVAGAEANAAVKYPCGIGMRLSYVYTYEHIRKGQPLTSSTRPHTATARIEYGRDWKRYGFNLALSGRWLSRVETDEYTSAASYEETERVRYPGYTMWKLTLSQRIARGIDLTAAVDNLFNYVPSYYYNNSPATLGTTLSVGLSVDIDRFFRK